MRLPTKLLMTAAGVALSSTAAFAVDPQPIVVSPPPAPPAMPVMDTPAAGAPYVTIFGGLLHIPPVYAQIVFGGGTPIIYVEPDLGYRVGGALGYEVGNFALEFEGTYGRTHLGFWDTEAGGDGGPITDPDSYATLISLMSNIRVELGSGAFRPFVAVGGGAVRLTLNDCCTWPSEIADSDWTWGAQVLAGVNVSISENASIGARYRFQYVGPTSFIDGGDDPVDVFGFGTHGVEVTLTLGGQ